LFRKKLRLVEAVLYLQSSGFVTGENLRVDGGVHAGRQYAVNELNLRSTILDGEIVALDKDGIPRFQILQQWQKRPTAPVIYYLFDLL
jgi:hypothetical protein